MRGEHMPTPPYVLPFFSHGVLVLAQPEVGQTPGGVWQGVTYQQIRFDDPRAAGAEVRDSSLPVQVRSPLSHSRRNSQT